MPSTLQIACVARVGYPAEQHAGRPVMFAVIANVDRSAGPEEKIENTPNLPSGRGRARMGSPGIVSEAGPIVAVLVRSSR